MVDWRDYIERRPGAAGKIAFKWSKISVEHILERLADGWGDDELLAAHPSLLPAHLDAARAYQDERAATRGRVEGVDAIEPTEPETENG